MAPSDAPSADAADAASPVALRRPATSGPGPAPWVTAVRGGLPADLCVLERPPAGGWAGYDGPVVVLVHGALDRASSFTRTARRLPEWGVVAYDRRGYQGSRSAAVTPGFDPHVGDLLAVVSAYGSDGNLVTAVGHSIGGAIVFAAALRSPERFASVGVYEPSMPWIGFRVPKGPARTKGSDPDREVERFFRLVAGDRAWDRLSERARATRRADGAALVTDLLATRAGAPFDVTALSVPAVIGRGGPAAAAHHRLTVSWLAAHVAGSELFEIREGAHGAHLTHPDAFARLVRDAAALGARCAGPEPAPGAGPAAAGTVTSRRWSP